MGTCLLTVEDLSKIYKTRSQTIVAFQNVNFSLNKGKCLVLLGRSGAGKTTLLKVIAQLIKPTTGRIYSTDNQKFKTSLVFQKPLLFPWLNVYENITLSQKFKTNIKKQSLAVEQLASELEIDHLLRRNVSNLSGGEAQRVSLARSLLNHPDLLLFDEPFSALDPYLKDNLRLWLKNLLNKKNLTSIFVTHDLKEATMLGDSIAVLDSFRGIVAWLDQNRTNQYSEDSLKSYLANHFGNFTFEETETRAVI